MCKSLGKVTAYCKTSEIWLLQRHQQHVHLLSFKAVLGTKIHVLLSAVLLLSVIPSPNSSLSLLLCLQSTFYAGYYTLPINFGPGALSCGWGRGLGEWWERETEQVWVGGWGKHWISSGFGDFHKTNYTVAKCLNHVQYLLLYREMCQEAALHVYTTKISTLGMCTIIFLTSNRYCVVKKSLQKREIVFEL